MSMPLGARDHSYPRSVRSAKPKKKHTYKVLFGIWALLIAGGVWGTKLYSDHLRDQIAGQIAAETKAQLDLIQKDYHDHLAEVQATVAGDMSKLQAKVDALNELLAFTKDSANSSTDNSNQLYTQLTELQKKLDDLKQSLEVLK